MENYSFEIKSTAIYFSLSKNRDLLRFNNPNAPECEYIGILIFEALNMFPKASFLKVKLYKDNKFVLLK